MDDEQWKKEQARRDEICAARETVQVGRMSAIDLRCMRRRADHGRGEHVSERLFGVVVMTARWPGAFEERGGVGGRGDS